MRAIALSAFVLFSWLGSIPAQGAVPPAPNAKPTTTAPATATPEAAADSVLAEVAGLQLTRADADAYVDALVFCLAKAGQDPRRLADDRAVVRDHLAKSFAWLPEAAQIDLADMTGIWQRAQQGWGDLAPPEKNAFSYGVLSLAFGEDEASKILHWNPRGALVEGTPVPGGRQSPSYGDDLDCLTTGQCASGGVALPE